MNIEELNEKFGILDKVKFVAGKGNFPLSKISNGFGTVDVSLYGAQVLSYQPINHSEVLWLSSKSAFENGKPIRGGIPICFPWFGPHATDAQKSMHGFARLKIWEVFSVNELSNGETELRLILKDDSTTKLLWQFSFILELIVTLGSSLKVTLKCTNTGNEKFTYTDALHSYFAVSDVEKIKIKGLKDTDYYDGIEGKIPIKQEQELLEIRREENRRYINTTAECVIEDTGFKRRIRIGKKGSRTTVVWNPWVDASKKMSDFTEDGFRTMICVEAANAYADIAEVAPGGSFSISTIITAESL